MFDGLIVNTIEGLRCPLNLIGKLDPFREYSIDHIAEIAEVAVAMQLKGALAFFIHADKCTMRAVFGAADELGL